VQKEGFVGEAGLGYDSDIRMMRPEIVEDGANLIAAGMGIDLGGELDEALGAKGRRHIEKEPQSAIHPGSSLP
jgi:hypothetical protein